MRRGHGTQALLPHTPKFANTRGFGYDNFMATSPIATAADYADAMMAARRAKNWLFLLLLLILLGQLAMFFALRHNPDLMGSSTPAYTTATTEASVPTTQPSGFQVAKLMEYFVAITSFAGIVLAIVLAAVQLLIVTIMLVGRLIGVSRVTSAFIWGLLLIVLLFPWQSLLLSPVTVGVNAQGTTNTEFKLPGVLYTWGEITHPTLGARFNSADLSANQAYLRWARFVIWPAIAVLLLLVIQSKSSRGLRMALGEVEFDVAEGTRSN